MKLWLSSDNLAAPLSRERKSGLRSRVQYYVLIHILALADIFVIEIECLDCPRWIVIFVGWRNP